MLRLSKRNGGSLMADDFSHFAPKFRWGAVSPTGGGTRVHATAAYQLYKLVPNDVMELSGGKGTELQLEDGKTDEAVANYWEAAEQMAKEKADAIVLSGVPVSANFGRAMVQKILKETTEKYGVKATSPFEAFLAAMNHLGLRSVTIGSRWGAELNNKVVQYCKDGGIEVKSITTRNQTVVAASGMSFDEGLETALAVGREAAKAGPDADAIFVPGGAAMAIHVIPILEKEAGKPTLTNRSCEVWQLLVHAKVIPPLQGWGKLLATA
jgi:maleate cis-trans isomerase